jgi:hypothetical protein
VSDPYLDVFPQKPVSNVAEVLAALAAIESAAPKGDGIACFNRLYRRTTENVAKTIDRGGFADPAFLARLDVVFANRYFLGVRACLEGAPDAPRAWLPLVEARGARTIAPIQFAFAGMNAHINRDLAPSLVDVFEGRAWPDAASAERHDYDKVNEVLAATEAEVKDILEGELLAEIDRALGEVDDLLALWSVRKARGAAWVWGETLFALEPHPRLASETMLTIDRMAALASRALLL